MKPIILASASPRRAQLLREAGVRFEVVVSPEAEPEKKPAVISTELWPMCLAHLKAAAVAGVLARRRGTRTILAADTIVVSPDGAILNKARDAAHARRMLRSLRGKEHRVITGVALMEAGGSEPARRVRLISATAVCRIRNVADAAIDRYVASGLWQGKAGAYGIQDAHDDPFVELVNGDFNTVMGLPVELVVRELAHWDAESRRQGAWT